MQDMVIELGAFAPAHIDEAAALSRAENWPHRPEDWALVEALSSGTVALSGGRVIGTAMTTPFGEAATVNMVIVAREARGQGLGRRLMEAAIGAAGQRECRLVATEEGLPLYRKLGFQKTGRVLQHQGIVGELLPPAGFDIAWADDPPVSLLGAMDREACGMDREALISRLARIGRVAILREEGAVAGFAILRDFGRGEVLGPLVAAGIEPARALAAFVLAARRGAFLRIDTTEEAGLAPFFAECGLAHAGRGIAMRRGGAAGAGSLPRFRTFALASQALG